MKSLKYILLISGLLLGSIQAKGPPFLKINIPTNIYYHQIIPLNIQTNFKHITYKLNDYHFQLTQASENQYTTSEILIPGICPSGFHTLTVVISLKSAEDFDKAEKIMLAGQGEIIGNSLQIYKEIAVELPKELAISYQPTERLVAGQKITILATIPTKTLSVTLFANKVSYNMQPIGGYQYHSYLSLPNSKQLTLTVAAKSKHGKILSKTKEIKIANTQQLHWQEISPKKTAIAKRVSQDFFELNAKKISAFSSHQTIGTAPYQHNYSRRENSLRIDLQGKDNNLNVQGNISISDQNYLEKQEDIQLKLFTKNWQLFWGDYLESLSQLTIYNKKLQGIYYQYQNKYSSIKLLASEPAGHSHQQYIAGNDSQGPFNLDYSPVIVGSEQIQKQGINLIRNKDYFFDYSQGQIILTNSLLRTGEMLQISYEYEGNYYDQQITAIQAITRLGKQKIIFNSISQIEQASMLSNKPTSNLNNPKNINLQSLAINLKKGSLEIYQELSQSKLQNNRETKMANGSHSLISANIINSDIQLDHLVVGKNYPLFGNSELQSGQKSTSLKILNPQLYIKHQQKSYPLQKKIVEKTTNLSNLQLKHLNFFHQEEVLTNLVSYNISCYNKNEGQLILPLGKYWQTSLVKAQERVVNLDYKKENNSTGIVLATKNNHKLNFLSSFKINSLKEDISSFNIDLEETEKEIRLLLKANPQLKINLDYLNIFNQRDGHMDILDFNFINSDYLKIESNYHLENLKQYLETELRNITKENGTLHITYDTLPSLRLKYNFQPQLIKINGDIPLIYNQAITDIWLISWAPYTNLSLQYQLQSHDNILKDPNSSKIVTDYQENAQYYSSNILLIKDIELELYQTKLKSCELSLETTDNYLSTIVKTEKYGSNIYLRPVKRLSLTLGGEKAVESKQVSENIETIDTQLYSSELNYIFNKIMSTQLNYQQATSYFQPNKTISQSIAKGIGIKLHGKNYLVSCDYSQTKEETQLQRLKFNTFQLTLNYHYTTLVNIAFNYNKDTHLQPTTYSETTLSFRLTMKF